MNDSEAWLRKRREWERFEKAFDAMTPGQVKEFEDLTDAGAVIRFRVRNDPEGNPRITKMDRLSMDEIKNEVRACQKNNSTM